MRAVIRPGSRVAGATSVPGDKSIAHRWLMLAATAEGSSVLRGLPGGEDVRSTARCMADLTGLPGLRDAFEGGASVDEGQGPTWNKQQPWNYNYEVRVQAEGRSGLSTPARPLDCGNSGTTIRLLMGLLAGSGVEAELTGDASLASRPMERIAEPLRAMGASISTTGGHAPVGVAGRMLSGVRYESPVPSAQLKSAVLLAGLSASGTTTVVEPAATRDHTERLLVALGAPLRVEGEGISVEAFQHEGFDGTAPGDPSSAVYLLAAAALTGGAITVKGVGLNPTRSHFLGVLERMGIDVSRHPAGEMMGEPVGDLSVASGSGTLNPVTVGAEELPLVIDEVPVLAALAAHADGDSRFCGAGELRHKESDRLEGTAAGLRALGGDARVDGDDLIVVGGGLPGAGEGAVAEARRDHRLAMAFAVTSLRAPKPVAVDGMESASVTFPGFHDALAELGADIAIEDPS